jgi:hypothetical protein
VEILFCFGGNGVWTEVLELFRQGALPLEPHSSLFCFGYFSNMVFAFMLRPVWSWFSYLFPSWLKWQVCSTMSSYWLRCGFTNFLLRLTLNCDLPNLCLPSGWEYRCELLPPGFCFVLRWCLFVLPRLSQTWAQVILLPQPPELQGVQACVIVPAPLGFW